MLRNQELIWNLEMRMWHMPSIRGMHINIRLVFGEGIKQVLLYSEAFLAIKKVNVEEENPYIFH